MKVQDMRKILVSGLLALSLAACSADEGAEDGSAHTGAAFGEQDLDSAESMERLAEAQRARQAHPGRAVYEENCAGCHEDGLAKAPHTSMIGMMTPEAVMRAMTTGLMQVEAEMLEDDQKVMVAEYLSNSKLGAGEQEPAPRCEMGDDWFDRSQPPVLNNWGITRENTRLIPPEANPLIEQDFANLELKWAIAIPGANRVRSQPGLAGGALYLGGQNAKVYALDAETGCMHWAFDAAGEVRTAIVVEPFEAGDAEADPLLFFGDVLGNVYAISALDGSLRWRDRPDDHPNATITGAPSYFDGKLLLPVSALESGPPVDPAYECCTFRGSVVAYDALGGEKLWQTFSIYEEPAPFRINSAGTQNYGPSGGTVWNAPAVDEKRRQIYFGTGENLSSPATLTSDAIFAVDVDTGAVKWTFQGTPDDAWNGACGTVNDANCPEEDGPDYDMAAGIILVSLSDGRELVVGGQKSGVVHALDPDTGEVVWQNPVGRGGVQGGIHFGMAAEGDLLFVPVTDMKDGRTYTEAARPGLHAIDMKTGEFAWRQHAPRDVCQGRQFCHPGNSQAATAAPGLVMAGSMDGVLRVHNSQMGDLVWQYDTTQEVTTLMGTQTSGGSMGGGAGPITANKMLYVDSGYGLYFHMPGNAFLAFGLKE
jgi:polyvinyl alcohol dehydrogenase (cytochrome)